MTRRRSTESEERFRAIFDAVNDGIGVQDIDSGELLDINERMPAMFGYGAEEIRRSGIAALGARPDDFTSRVAAASAGEEQTFEWRARHKDGHEFWTEVNLRAASIAGVRRLIVVMRDIAQRKEMEAALRAEKELTDAAIDSIPGVFFVQTREGRYVRWNETMERVAGWGVPLRERTGRPALHPDDRAYVEARVGEVFDKGEAIDIASRVILGEPPQVRHFVFSARRMESGGERYLVATGMDVTESLQLQQRIARSAAEWRETFDAVGTPIAITERDGTIVRVNRAARELSGLTDDALAGRALHEVDAGEPWQTAEQLVRYAVEHQSGNSAETKDATGRTWDVTIASFTDGQDSERFIFVLWDVTRIVELQESLRRSTMMSAMGTLVAAVAHEVRNPLFGISATLDAFRDELAHGGLEECAASLRREVARLIRLMQELLDFGRQPVLQIEQGRLYEVVKESVERRRPDARNAKVEIRNLFKDGTVLLMDRTRMGQVFDNLIENARQHAPQGGWVRVSSALVDYAGRRWLEARIEDNGPGFGGDVDRVFEPFFTRRSGGTGLGLSIVQRIVEEHGGKVTASNRPGGGACVTVRLPVRERPHD